MREDGKPAYDSRESCFLGQLALLGRKGPALLLGLLPRGDERVGRAVLEFLTGVSFGGLASSPYPGGLPALSRVGILALPGHEVLGALFVELRE